MTTRGAEVELGDVCEFKYGKSLPAASRQNGPIPVYGSNGIVGSHSVAITDGPAVIIGRKGSFGEVTYSASECWPIDTAYYIDSTSTRADLKWLAHRLKGLGLTQLNRAAAIPGLNRDDAYRQRLLLPPVDEQRRIAGILDRADAIRAKRRQVLAHLDTLSRSIFHDIFGAERFESFEFGSVASEMRNGVSPSTRGTVVGTVLTLSAITQGRFDPGATKSAKFDSEPSGAVRVDSRDFLICRGNGNKSLVGVGVRSRESRLDLVFPDTVIAARMSDDRVDLSYLEAVWRQPATRRQLEAAARTTNGTYKVNQQALSAVQIPLPPPELQREFAARAEQVNAQRAVVQRALDVDSELFESLQARAFRGEL